MTPIPPKERDNKGITQALLKAQKSFPPIEPDSTNPYFNSRYISLAGLLKLVTPVLNANGLALTQPFGYTEDLRVLLVTQLRHISGEFITSELPVNAKVDMLDKNGKLLFVKENSQTLGSALTYARKYSVMSILGIATVQDDDDGQAASHQPAAPINFGKE